MLKSRQKVLLFCLYYVPAFTRVQPHGVPVPDDVGLGVGVDEARPLRHLAEAAVHHRLVRRHLGNV